jgi:hypothetical protein
MVPSGEGVFLSPPQRGISAREYYFGLLEDKNVA